MTSTDHPSLSNGPHKNKQPNTRPGALLINIQSRALAKLSDLLRNLFEHLDEALFDLAEHAASNNEQNLYFEAMRELRLRKRDVDQSLRECIGKAFDDLQEGKQAPANTEINNLNLSLVEKDNAELDVAISNMRSRLRTQYPDLLLHLSQRLNQHLAIDWLTEHNIPLGAQPLVDAFVSAVEPLKMPLKIRLMVFKYYERHVIDHLRQILEDSNKILADAGINPLLKKPEKNNENNPADKENDDVSAESPPSTNMAPDKTDHSIDFQQVQTILSNFYSGSLNHRLFSIQAGHKVPELSLNDLQGVLTTLQQAQSSSLHDEEPSHYDHEDVRLLLEHKLAQTVREQGVRKLRQADDDVINLVNMVFCFILDDHQLPPEMSLLLGRLQIPLIKVALADKTFFSNPMHPARRLLKQVSKAAIGWERESVLQRDLLMEEIRSLVSRVLNEFTLSNMSLFDELERSFLHFLDDEKKRAERVEKRVVQAAQGQAKMEQARKNINQMINDRMQGKTLPEIIIDLVDGPWRVLMLQTMMRHGRDSDQWRQCLKVLDDLLWSIQPSNANQERERWIKMIPALLKTICKELESIQHPGLGVDKFRSALWSIHGQILKNPPNRPLPNSRKVDHTINPPVPTLDAKTLSAIERQKRKAEERRALLDPGQFAEADLRKSLLVIKPGQWIEVITLEGKLRRCKLAIRDTAHDLYIFVSRRGNKVLETNIDSLVRMAMADELRILDGVSIWDRGIVRVLNKLRNPTPSEEAQPTH